MCIRDSIYAVDTTDAAKREVADQLIRDTLAAGNGTTSYQVAQEFLNVCLLYTSSCV